ncbi:MAG: 2-polyprenylphenol 6-hydroxylase, partial [Alphaproteobacteria bacterium]|nr:2-polyprenylphenol 6-hydroxylase [Alphaproteobacteria bacterium]
MLRGLRNFGRLIGIGVTLARHDALFWLDALPPGAKLHRLMRVLAPKPGAAIASKRPGERLARALQSLGPSFIKLGQALATRADLIGDDIAADLAQLQDRLAPFPGVVARSIIEAELGRPLDSAFQQFELGAVAAASIAQVHFAVTADG